MGHRHLSNTWRFFQVEQDLHQSHVAAGQSYIHMGRAVAPENGSFYHPMENIPTTGLDYISWHNFENRSIQNSSTNFRLETPQVRASNSASSYDTFPPFPAGGSFYRAPEINAAHAPFNHYNQHVIDEVENRLPNHTTGTARGPFKRKSPSISTSCERGSTSRFYGAGSSSNSFDPQLEKPTSEYINYFSGSIGIPTYQGGSLTIHGGDPPRNVRSRSGLDWEPNPRTYLSSNSSHPQSSSSRLQNQPGVVDVANLNVDATAHEHNYIGISAAAHGRFQTSVNNSLNHGMSRYYAGESPAEFGGYRYDSISSRNPVASPRYLHGLQAQAAREGHSSHRTDLCSFPLGQEQAASENGQQFLSETFPSTYLRPLSAGDQRNNHREGRPRIAIERFQSFSDAVDAHDRMGSEALMMLDHPYLYGSRNLFDQYGDMRLDIDNMGYEELLALGERIGNVNTGLSEDLISKCLIEITYPSTNKDKKEASCAICLEEYKNMDIVGTVKNCGHDYHVNCIKKWLSMKNACPICKAPALADGSNRK